MEIEIGRRIRGAKDKETKEKLREEKVKVKEEREKQRTKRDMITEFEDLGRSL